MVELAASDPEPRLDPTVYAPVEVNGVATDAVTDTGSPATTISLEFVLKVCQGQDQTAQQWKEATHQRLRNHTEHSIAMGVTNYTELSLRATSTILVQKDASNNLLIGTDVQSRLGFSLVLKKLDGRTADCSVDKKWLCVIFPQRRPTRSLLWRLNVP